MIVSCHVALAEERNWSGFGANGEWQNRTNWSAWFLPVPGDSLSFTDPLAPRRVATNDFPSGTVFSNLTVGSSYKLYGNGVLLQGELNGGTAEIHLPVAFDRDTTIRCFERFSILSHASLSNLDHRILFYGFGTQIVSTIVAASEVRLMFPGVLRLTNASFYTGQTIVDAGELSMEHNQALGVAGPGSGTIINPSGKLRLREGLETAEPLAIAGQIIFPGSPTHVVAVNWRGEVDVFGDALLNMPASTLLLHAPVHGIGKLIVSAGTLSLHATNDFGGVQVNAGGELRLMGYQPQVPVLLNGGLLTGLGTCGEILGGKNVSTIRPGTFPFNLRVGTLTTSNLFLTPKVRYEVELTSSGADKLVVHGSVDLNDAVLALGIDYSPTNGTEFLIVDNDGADPVTGQFAGLPQDSLFQLGNGARLRIDYSGGDGNDVVLRVDHTQLRFAGDWYNENNLWSNRYNWQYGLLPDIGDELVFNSVYSKMNTNDLAPYRTYRALVFSGNLSSDWHLHGNPIVLTHGIFDASTNGTNVIALDIGTTDSLTISNYTGTLLITGNIAFDSNLELHTEGTMIVAGQIAGSGRVQKTGNGMLIFRPAGGFPPSRIARMRLADGGFELTGWGLPGVMYAIEGSENLKDWNRIGEAVCADSGEYVFEDLTGLQRRFYRVRSPD